MPAVFRPIVDACSLTAHIVNRRDRHRALLPVGAVLIQQLQPRQQGGQRSAQLVGDIGNKIALQALGAVYLSMIAGVHHRCTPASRRQRIVNVNCGFGDENAPPSQGPPLRSAQPSSGSRNRLPTAGRGPRPWTNPAACRQHHCTRAAPDWHPTAAPPRPVGKTNPDLWTDSFADCSIADPVAEISSIPVGTRDPKVPRTVAVVAGSGQPPQQTIGLQWPTSRLRAEPPRQHTYNGTEKQQPKAPPASSHQNSSHSPQTWLTIRYMATGRVLIRDKAVAAAAHGLDRRAAVPPTVGQSLPQTTDMHIDGARIGKIASAPGFGKAVDGG